MTEDAAIPIAGEFGHFASVGGGVCIDAWGAGPFIIITGGKSFRFEDSDRFGPSLVKVNGDIKSNPFPPEKSAFWIAHRCWTRQGRRVEEDGITCIFSAPRPTTYRMVGRKRRIVKWGDEGGGYIEVQRAGSIVAKRARRTLRLDPKGQSPTASPLGDAPKSSLEIKAQEGRA